MAENTGAGDRIAGEKVEIILDHNNRILCKSVKRVFMRRTSIRLLMASMIALLIMTCCVSASAERINDEAFRPAARERAEELVPQLVTMEMSEYEKALTLYDWICANVEYDHDYIYTGNCTSEYGVDLAGALLGGWAVCEGFAEAYELMLELAGIPAEKVVGWGGGAYGGGHAWVAAKVEGEWHLFDPTWDEAGDGTWHHYFGLNEEAFDLLHDKETHNNLYCNGFKANYKYREGLYSDTLEELASAVEERIAAGIYAGELTTTEAWDTRDQMMLAAILSAKTDWGVAGRVEMKTQTVLPYGLEYVFYPDEVPVTSIVLDGVDVSARYTRMYPGYSVQLRPVTTPANADVTYRSINESVLKVTDSGRLTAVGTGGGSVEISAGGLKYVLSVWVYEIDQLGFWVTAGNYSTRIGLRRGETTQGIDVSGCSDYLLMAQKGITWTSDDPSIASVDKNGLITTHKDGITYIRADWLGLAQCELEIQVREPITGIRSLKRIYHFSMEDEYVYLEAQIECADPKGYYERYGEIEWIIDAYGYGLGFCDEFDQDALRKSGYTLYREMFWVMQPDALDFMVRGSDLSEPLDTCLVIIHPRDSVTLPESLYEIEAEAFAGAAAEEFILPEGVSRIGSHAFADCKKLIMVTIPNGDIEIADDAFEGCDDVLILCPEGSSAQAYAKEKGMRYKVLP